MYRSSRWFGNGLPYDQFMRKVSSGKLVSARLDRVTQSVNNPLTNSSGKALTFGQMAAQFDGPLNGRSEATDHYCQEGRTFY
ncbi:MAG: hypothetical protein RLN96_02330 [Pseudomonadales bacterium]